MPWLPHSCLPCCERFGVPPSVQVKPLLSNTAFELRRGRRYGIVGQNGAGKTTLMSRPVRIKVRKSCSAVQFGCELCEFRRGNNVDGQKMT